MIKINLNGNSADDVKRIMLLRKMGMSDKDIQEIYERTETNRKIEQKGGSK